VNLQSILPEQHMHDRHKKSIWLPLPAFCRSGWNPWAIRVRYEAYRSSAYIPNYHIPQDNFLHYFYKVRALISFEQSTKYFSNIAQLLNDFNELKSRWPRVNHVPQFIWFYITEIIDSIYELTVHHAELLTRLFYLNFQKNCLYCCCIS